uniref:Coiled-coil and C2 domain-containing protein 1B n=1 Tax=Oncorhynchus tshawytscha TaxID=74940 RepID=A0A8C8IFT0_ONCTS
SGMFGKKKRAPLPKGQGAAAAKQMGLFVDFNPEDMTQDMDDPTVDDADLEAELSALTGGKTAGGRLKQKGKSSHTVLYSWLEGRQVSKNLFVPSPYLCASPQSLESMLVSLKKGRKVDEADIPPPVAGGAPTSTAPPRRTPPPPPSGLEPEPTPPQQQGEPEAAAPAEMLSVSPEAVSPSTILEKDGVKVVRLEDVIYFLYLISHNLSSVALSLGVISALSGPEKEPGPGQTSSPNPPASTPPAPSAVPAQPKDVLEALEQRRDRYQEACAQAKASGDDRKARMHERIAKQYQSAIRTHKAGRAVNYAELPVPPGFHPIPGQEGGVGAEQGFSAMLEAANKLASEETIVTGEEEGENEEVNYFFPSNIVKSFQEHVVPLLPTALQQLDFVEGRRQQYMKAALQAKQKNDMDAARTLLRTAKGLEPLIDAVKAGKHVDISKVPSPPGDEDEDFILVHHSEVQISEKADEVYTQLAKMLKEQYEKCMTYSKQFTHLGNIAETTKFEKMAESCKKSLEMLKLSQSKRLDPPKHHFEERTYHTVRIFPDLSSTEMVVVVVRGMNLPAPSGIATNDLDAYVKFDFPYPSTEQPQKHRTAVVKNTNSPEFNQGFTLNINRNHRGFRRVVQSKGLKLELLHKGGFLRSDKPIGTAHIKLEKLETESEVREIVEVIDGRKPTGGRVEVRVRLREPLSGQDLQTTTERWLVLDQSQVHLE